MDTQLPDAIFPLTIPVTDSVASMAVTTMDMDTVHSVGTPLDMSSRDAVDCQLDMPSSDAVDFQVDISVSDASADDALAQEDFLLSEPCPASPDNRSSADSRQHAPQMSDSIASSVSVSKTASFVLDRMHPKLQEVFDPWTQKFWLSAYAFFTRDQKRFILMVVQYFL